MSELTSIQMREAVRGVLERALAAVTDTFVVEVGDDEHFTAYVQVCVEDERDIHLELMHESFSLLPLAASAGAALSGLGWNEQNEDFPNYWQRVSREDLSDQEIAHILVTSLDEVYDIFQRWAHSPAITVKPGEIAARALGSEFEITEIEVAADFDWEAHRVDDQQ